MPADRQHKDVADTVSMSRFVAITRSSPCSLKAVASHRVHRLRSHVRICKHREPHPQCGCLLCSDGDAHSTEGVLHIGVCTSHASHPQSCVSDQCVSHPMLQTTDKRMLEHTCCDVPVQTDTHISISSELLPFQRRCLPIVPSVYHPRDGISTHNGWKHARQILGQHRTFPRFAPHAAICQQAWHSGSRATIHGRLPQVGNPIVTEHVSSSLLTYTRRTQS
jgi:hypothetical protein